MRVGILGGTFDPIHRGHLAAARVAMECAHLDQVWFVPSAQPPHRAAAVAPAEDRLAMARLAIDAQPGFAVSDVEIRRGGHSFTVDTLLELQRERPDDDLYLILGWDAARQFSTWHQPDVIRRVASFVVVGRPGTPSPSVRDLEAAGLDPGRVVLCLEPTPDISGSALRSALSHGRPVHDSLHAAVERYIAERRLYGDNR